MVVVGGDVKLRSPGELASDGPIIVEDNIDFGLVPAWVSVFGFPLYISTSPTSRPRAMRL